MAEFAFVFIFSKEFCVANQTRNIDNQKPGNETINEQHGKRTENKSLVSGSKSARDAGCEGGWGSFQIHCVSGSVRRAEKCRN